MRKEHFQDILNFKITQYVHLNTKNIYICILYIFQFIFIDKLLQQPAKIYDLSKINCLATNINLPKKYQADNKALGKHLIIIKYIA